MKKIWNKLWIRLALVFGIFTFASITLVAIIVSRQTDRRFRDYLAYTQLADSETFKIAADYYSENGTWQGISEVLADHLSENPPAINVRFRRPAAILLDKSGAVLYDNRPHIANRFRQRHSLDNAVAIKVEGETVGYLLLPPNENSPQLTATDQRFLDQITRFLIHAGIIASVITLLLGFIVARGLTAPLSRLTNAARGISQGNLRQKVPVQGAEEIAELAEAFNEMADALHEGENLRRNMVADISHELRTPLTVVQGNLRAILDDVYQLDKSEIAAIYNQTLTLKRLVNDLYELSQAEAHQLKLNVQAIELALVVEEMTDLFHEVAREQGIALSTALPTSLPRLFADADRVRQCLYNLLANALRHTPSGGQIAITAQPHSDTIRIGVSDTGEGIAPNELQNVFERFWRADKARSSNTSGAGLGLAITRQLVLAQGGQIGVESTLGKGSLFWFTLPTA